MGGIKIDESELVSNFFHTNPTSLPLKNLEFTPKIIMTHFKKKKQASYYYVNYYHQILANTWEDTISLTCTCLKTTVCTEPLPKFKIGSTGMKKLVLERWEPE